MNTAVATTNEPRWKVTLNTAMPSIREALPAHITEAKFRQVAAAAIGSTPMLKKCMEENPKAVLTALSQCASDGLLPDNRQAALVPFKSKDGMNLTYIPMIAGVLIRMRNSGEVESVVSRIVHAKDHFEIEYGDDEKFTHKPPTDGSDRGEPIGAYAIIRLKGGEVYREFMSKSEIMKVKAASRAKGGPWSGSFETEMWRKTVLKRAAKYCPFSNEMADLMNRDNSFYDPERTIDATPKQTVADRFASQIAQDSAEDVSPGDDMPEDENAAPDEVESEYEYIPDAEFTEPADDETEQPGDQTSPSSAGAEEGGDDPRQSPPPPSAPSTEDLPAKPLISKPIMAKADAIKKAKSAAEATQMFERFEQSDLGQQCTDQEFEFVKDARDWRVRQGA